MLGSMLSKKNDKKNVSKYKRALFQLFWIVHAGICARARKLSSRPTEWPRPKVKSTGRQGKIPETNTRKYPLAAEEIQKYKKRANAVSKAMYGSQRKKSKISIISSHNLCCQKCQKEKYFPPSNA